MGGENRKVGWWFHYFYSICSTSWSLGLHYLDNHNNICESIGNYKSFLPSPRAILHPPSKFASITELYIAMPFFHGNDETLRDYDVEFIYLQLQRGYDSFIVHIPFMKFVKWEGIENSVDYLWRLSHSERLASYIFVLI